MEYLLWGSFSIGIGMKYKLVFTSGAYVVVRPVKGDLLVAKARGENDFKVQLDDLSVAYVDMTHVMYIVEVRDGL